MNCDGKRRCGRHDGLWSSTSTRRRWKSCGPSRRDATSEKNVCWRQALSYWEMAASLVLRGALDAELFLDSNVEGILIYAKFHHFHAETEKQSGNPFMKQTATLIEKYPGGEGSV